MRLEPGNLERAVADVDCAPVGRDDVGDDRQPEAGTSDGVTPPSGQRHTATT